MRKLILLTLLGGALAVAVGVLYAMGRSGLTAESHRIQSEASAAQRQTLTAVRTQVARALTDVVERETKRPYYQYSALYVPPGLVAQQPAFVPSPLARAPEDPLVKCYFEFREGSFTSPALFEPRQQKQNKRPNQAMTLGSSPYRRTIRPLLQELSRHSQRLQGLMRVPNPKAGPVFQRVIDSYVHALNRRQELYLRDLGQDQDQGRQVAMNRAWKASQKRVGKVPGQYQAPRPSKQPVEVKRYPFEVIPLGAEEDGWPRHLVAMRRVSVGKEAWLQGFAFAVSHLRRATLPQAVAGQSTAYEPGISPSLDWSRVRALESSPGQTIGDMVDLVPSAQAGDLSHETLPLLEPLQGLTLVHRRGPVDTAAALRPSRTLLDGALGLAGAVVLLGSVILLVAARGQQRLAQQRADFVAALTHELKAPLTGMRALAEMLHDGLVSDEAKKQEYYASMLSEAERLGRLVQNVLDAAKLERGALSVCCEPLDPGPLLADISGRFRSRYEILGLTLEVDLGDETPLVLADRESLVQVVANLLDNAAKYGKGGENKIRLNARVQGEQLLITVRDQGPGIPPQERERIFERFFRSPNAPREAGGAGLGLAIARAQARAQGGDLLVDEADGGGACFTLQVPLALSETT